MLSRVTKDVSRKQRVLAVLAAAGLALALSGPTLAADAHDNTSSRAGAVSLGRKPGVISGLESITLGSKPGIGSGSNRSAGTSAI
jgi:hypothetical protein